MVRISKKSINVILCSLLLTWSLLAQTVGKTVQVITPNIENIPKSFEAWLPGQIRDNFKENLRGYTNYTLTVDDTNERQLKNLQRKSESASYDSDTIIEAGKITNAQYALFSTIRKAGSQYTINIVFLNLTTGINEAVANSSGRKDVEELFSGANSAVDELTIKLCDQLNIKLTPTQRFVLQNGSAELSVEQQITLEKQAEENYKKRLAELNKEISNTNGSTDLDTIAKRQQLEAERDLTLERQQTALRHQQELQKQLEQEQKDAEQEQLRTLAQLEKRNAMEKEIEEAAAKIRKENHEKQSVLGQINLIESKKKALVSIRNSVDSRLEELRLEAEQELAEYQTKLESEPLRAGEPADIARQRRQEKLDAKRKELQKRVEDDQAAVLEKVKEQDSSLLKDIRKSQTDLEKKRTVSSFGNELEVSYGSYNTNNTSWTAHLSLYADGILLDEDTFYISYESLTGKTVPNLSKASDEVYNDYLDTIDTYSSLFMRGSPILNYELDYKVEALPDHLPSSYKFSFLELRIKDTSKNRIIQTSQLRINTITRNWAPAYDIRTHEKIESQALKSEEQLYRENHYDQKRGNGGFSGIRIGGGYSTGKFAAAEINMSHGTRYLFMILDSGITAIPEPVLPIAKNNFQFYLVAGLGLNKRINIGNYPPTIYLWSALGPSLITLNSECVNIVYDNEKKTYSASETSTGMLNRTALGLEIPFGRRVGVYLQGNLNLLNGAGSELYRTVDVIAGLSFLLN